MNVKVYLLLCIVGSASMAAATTEPSGTEENLEKSDQDGEVAKTDVSSLGENVKENEPDDKAWAFDYMKIIDMGSGWADYYAKRKDDPNADLTPDDILDILLRIKISIPSHKWDPYRQEVDGLISLSSIDGRYCNEDMMRNRYPSLSKYKASDKIRVYVKDRESKQFALCESLFKSTLAAWLDSLSESEKDSLNSLGRVESRFASDVPLMKTALYIESDKLEFAQLVDVALEYLESTQSDFKKKLSWPNKKEKLALAFKPLFDICSKVNLKILDYFGASRHMMGYKSEEAEYANKAYVCKKLMENRRYFIDRAYKRLGL